jgi:hypothetical protein
MLKNILRKGGHTPAWIFSNHVPHSKFVIRDKSEIQEAMEESNIHEHILEEEDLEFSSSSPYEKIEESWTKSDGEKTIEP